MMKSFKDLLKRGNVPDDDRVVPNWMKIKNRQFDDVDITNNSIDEIISLSSEEFNEFASSIDHTMLVVYLHTVSDVDMKRFYTYLDDVVKLKEDVDAPSAKEQFREAMQKIDMDDISDEAKLRVTLETPLMIKYAKNFYHKSIEFREYISQDYYDYGADDAFKMYEGSLSKIIWNDMKYIPDNFEQVLDHFKENFYDEANKEHQKFVEHLAKRFGLLIATLNNLVIKTENRNSSLNWFTGVMVEQKVLTSGDISVSKTKSLSTDQKLINLHALTFLAIVDENDDNYISNLIAVVETMFAWYPVNSEACEYVMVEMMKSIAIKKVNVENANAFIDFFGELPRFYEVLSYDKIYELKELIVHTLETHKPHKNEIFDHKEVKSTLILMNYKIDMEDLYYESGEMQDRWHLMQGEKLMREEKYCQYLNDIKGCEVRAVYECGDFIEIQYLKEGVPKSLVIEYHVYGSSMGYGSFFRLTGVELPQHVFRGERMCTKMPSETLTRMQSIIEINMYRHNAHGYGDSEELEIVYETKSGKKETYLLGFELESEDDWLQNRCHHNKKPTFEKRTCENEEMPKELFSIGDYKEVLAFALKVHEEQKTPEGLPYSFHIVSVAMEVINSLTMHPMSYEEANVAIACALLHDVVEDTSTTIGTDSLNIPNIRTVLQGVWALTKDEKLPTKQEQMQDSLKRLQLQPKCVQMVKLADRITNLAPAPLFWNTSKRRSYLNEAKMILDVLKSANPYLALKLQGKIDSYLVDKVKNKFGEEKNDDYVVFHAKDCQLILDKNHPDYLKTFKALNRLNEYVFNTYDIRLFKREHADYDWVNRDDIAAYTNRVGVKYITSKLNTKDLLDLNRQTDENIAKYFAVILEGEGVCRMSSIEII